MENNEENDQKTFTINLTETEIAIIKAGLRYLWIADSFECSIFETQPGASLSLRDLHEYEFQVGEINKKLYNCSKCEPYYGLWCNIEKLRIMYKEAYEKAKWEGDREWEEMFLLPELKGTIRCLICGRENKPDDLKFDYSKPRDRGWYYLKCINGHTIHQSPYSLLLNSPENKRIFNQMQKDRK